MPRIINLRFERADPALVAYVGRLRRSDMHYGNPFSHKPLPHCVLLGSRDESVDGCREWLLGRFRQDVEPHRRLWILANLHRLAGKDLACWCAPARCHSEVLMDLAAMPEDQLRALQGS